MVQEHSNKYVYRLYHWRDEDNDETYKEIGHYSSREKANQVIEKYKTLPGFYAYPDCFTIDKVKIDCDFWTEGFNVYLVQVPLKGKKGYATVRARGEFMKAFQELWYGLFEVISNHKEEDLLYPIDAVVKATETKPLQAIEMMAENYESFSNKYNL